MGNYVSYRPYFLKDAGLMLRQNIATVKKSTHDKPEIFDVGPRKHLNYTFLILYNATESETSVSSMKNDNSMFLKNLMLYYKLFGVMS